MDPEYARIAAFKHGNKIIREQINLDKISRIAVEQLRVDSKIPTGDTKSSIDDDWLNSFEKEASQKSTVEMQMLFGKILAGEIRNPSSFSIKTLKLISQLDQRCAQLFRILCSLSVSMKAGNGVFDARVLSLDGNAAHNSLSKYGLTFDSLNLLQEYGLIISDYNSWMNYHLSIFDQNGIAKIPFNYQGLEFGLESADPEAIKHELKFHGVAFSISGKELLTIVDIVPNETYTLALDEFFRKKNFSMRRLNIKN